MVRGMFRSKDPAEKISLPFYFTDDLSGATIASAVAGFTVDAGTDATPAAMANGALVISAGVVYVPVQGGFAQVDYIIGCTATLSDGRVLKEAGLLPVRVK